MLSNLLSYKTNLTKTPEVIYPPGSVNAVIVSCVLVSTHPSSEVLVDIYKTGTPNLYLAQGLKLVRTGDCSPIQVPLKGTLLEAGCTLLVRAYGFTGTSWAIVDWESLDWESPSVIYSSSPADITLTVSI